MNFFDGKSKSQPLINLSGASRQKTREELIREAALERQRREKERRQQLAATKIQSTFKSYLVRKQLKIECRREFDKQFTNNKQYDARHLVTLLPYFVNIYDQKLDIDRLTKISQFIIQHKQTVIELLCQQEPSFSFTFAKFLVINLKVLNQSTLINHAIPLRLIEFFTDRKSFASSGNAANEISAFIFNYLIKNKYVSQLVSFCLSKIAPNMSKQSVNIPAAQSICDLFLRAFLYLNSNSDDLNKNIVKAITSELFTKVYKTQIRYCIIERLSTLIRDHGNAENNLQFLFTFLKLNQVEQTNNFTYESFQSYNYNLFNLYSILKLYQHSFSTFSNEQFKTYLSVIHVILSRIPILDETSEQNEYSLIFSSEKKKEMNANTSDEPMDEDNDDEVKADFTLNELEDARINVATVEESNYDEGELDIEKFNNKISHSLLNELLTIFDSTEFSSKINNYFACIDGNNNSVALNDFCLNASYICNFVRIKSNLKMHQSILLRTVGFNKRFLSVLWKYICSLNIRPNEKQEIFLTQLLASGSTIDQYDQSLFTMIPPLTTFCSLYNLYLLPILDEEFLKGEAIFSKADLIKISSILKDICLGIIRLMHPDTKPLASPASSSYRKQQSDVDGKIKAIYFTHLFQACCLLVQRMHTRDIRRAYCPEDHWLSNTIIVTANRLTSVLNADQPILTMNKFGHLSYLFQTNSDLDVKLSVNDVRSLTVLQELPFVVPFKERVQILQSFLAYEPFNVGERSYRIRIRRDYLYEDAFDDLSLENAPNLKTARITVEMINQLGVDEAGIDGGGLFREFMLKVLETGFDPNRGFFIMTSDGFLYPNPNVRYLVENYHHHYFFLGRLLAKAIQSNILSELKFADFFLQKLLTKYSESRLDIDYLASLDPVVYKNLLYLKDLKGNVEDLGLNFAVDTNEFGKTSSIELKPGGKDMPVTSDNKIEYIHLLADYKLNKQINEQVQAFRNGMGNVIDLEYLRLFNFHELENLISGTVETIDVNDWRRYTVYAGDYSNDHPVIELFWEIVENFDEEKKRKLLKFATSRSRPPLFGFKNLIPNFAVHSSGSEDRLPSASTCMNLLKLPPVHDYKQLKAKLICAIEAEAGFDLS